MVRNKSARVSVITIFCFFALGCNGDNKVSVDVNSKGEVSVQSEETIAKELDPFRGEISDYDSERYGLYLDVRGREFYSISQLLLGHTEDEILSIGNLGIGPIGHEVDMNGLEQFSNLTKLSMGACEIEGSLTLRSLQNFKFLDLQGYVTDKVILQGSLPSFTEIKNGKTDEAHTVSVKGIENAPNLSVIDFQQYDDGLILSLEEGPIHEGVKKIRGGMNDMSPLSRFPNLEWAVLMYGGVQEIEGLEDKPNLEYINLTSNPLNDNIDNLYESNAYRQITLSDTGLTNGPQLTSFSRLEILQLENNQIQDTEFLIEDREGKENLRAVYLDNNEISDMTFIKHLPHVTWISLDNNQIERIDGIAQLSDENYGNFRLRGNPVKEIVKADYERVLFMVDNLDVDPRTDADDYRWIVEGVENGSINIVE